MTVGQALIFAGRVRSLYLTGDPEQGAAAFHGQDQGAYAPYLRYLRAEGVLGSELDGSYASAATRRRWPMCWQPRCRRGRSL